jgi:hypothetical protein
MNASALPERRPRAWIDRCAAQLCSGDGGLDPGSASDTAARLWEREAWRGNTPEQVAVAYLQSEALLTHYRERLTGARHGD